MRFFPKLGERTVRLRIGGGRELEVRKLSVGDYDRVNALIREVEQDCAADDLALAARAALMERGGRRISLTAKELALLLKLYENRNRIVTGDALCEAVWGDGLPGYENTLMVHIRRLREKIEEDPSKPRFLLTVRGLGYKLVTEGSNP